MRILMAIIFCLFWMGVSGAEEKGILPVDSFSGAAGEKGIPAGWSLEKEPGSSSKISVGREQENYFLHLLSVDDSFGLKKEMEFDIRKYPYLSWRWKATQLPKGGDIRRRDTDDQAGQVYVIFPKFPTKLNSRSMGYIWDSTAPVGASGTSTAYSKMKYLVLQSGVSRVGQWVPETRNVYEDYKKFFQEEPPQVGAAVLYINSQHTKSSAECFFGEIYFSSKAPKATP